MNSNYYKEIISRLKILIKKEYLLEILLGIILTFNVIILSGTFFSILEVLFYFSSILRTIIFFVLLLILLALAGNKILLPLLKFFGLVGEFDFLKTAQKVGKHFNFVQDDLLNAMQLAAADFNKSTYSSLLIGAAFEQVYHKVENVRFESIVNFKRAKLMLHYSSALLLLIILLFSFIPGLGNASIRIMKFNEEFLPPQKFYITIEPGNAQITKGEDVHFRILLTGDAPKKIFFSIKSDEETDFKNIGLKPDSNGIFYFYLKNVRTSLEYFASAENISSDQFRIEVIDRPVIRNFEVTVTPPAYSGMKQYSIQDNGNVTGLNGSLVSVKIISSKDLKYGQLFFSDSSLVKLSINGSEAKGNFRISKDVEYHADIFDQLNKNNLSPINYFVKVLNDEYPQIEVIAPNKNTILANDNRQPLFTKIADDYGFDKLILNYKIKTENSNEEKSFQKIELPVVKKNREQDVNYIWNLSFMNLAANDEVQYFFEVFDNDNISGPKSTKSSSFIIRVPSLNELLNLADKTQNEIQTDLKETLKDANDLKEELNKLTQDLKKDKTELSWDEKDQVQKSLEKFEDLQKKIDETSQQFDEMKDQLQENNLLSKETLEKYMELQELLDQLTSEEMKKAMKQLQNMMQNMKRDQNQQALEDFKMDEEKFQKGIERTLNLLKRIQIEQKLDELTKRTEQLAEEQSENQKQIENQNSAEQKEQLKKNQEDISKELEQLSQEMKELADKMDDFKDMPNDQMKQMMNEFNEQQNQQLSEDAMKQMQQNDMQSAMKNQKQISSNMQKMNQMMQQMQQSMNQQNQMQTFSDMMKMMDNILMLSKQQEELKNRSQNMDQNSSEYSELSQKQNEISANLDKLMKQMSELSQKTFAITPEMGKALGDAKKEMQKSLQSLQNRNGNYSAIPQTDAMQNLNIAANMMKGSMESMMQSGGQGGMMSLMQQMQKLSGQQMSLNNLTQMLKQMQQGSLSMQQQSELQRLANQQQTIQKSLEQLKKEAELTGKSKTMPGNLNKIMEQMQEVITDMKTQKLDDELIQNQEKILSKMLDAQKSINERDFEKQRESYTGKNIAGQSPADLNLNKDQKGNRILDELNSAVKEGYKKDYENLIKKYYEALQNEKVRN